MFFVKGGLSKIRKTWRLSSCSRVVSVGSIEVIGAEMQYQTQPVVMCGAVALKEGGQIFLTLYNPCTDLDICISMATTQSVGFARAAIFWTMPSFIKGDVQRRQPLFEM